MAFYRPRVYRVVFSMMFVLSLISCTKSDDDSDTPEPSGITSIPTRSEDISGATGEDGRATVPFTLDNSVRSLQIVASAETGQVRVISVASFDLELLFDSTDLLHQRETRAYEIQPSPVALNLPLLSEGIQRGVAAGSYQVTVEVEDSNTGLPLPSVPVQITIVIKRDSDLTSGVIPATVVLAGATGTSEENRESVMDSIEVAREILVRGGIGLSIVTVSLPELPNTLPNPYLGDPIYDEMAKVGNERLMLYFAADVANLRNPENEFGQAGGIPGPFIASPRSAIAFSLTSSSGGDGIFDSDDDSDDARHTSEIRILGEAIAHEILHYAGLVNSVEFQGNTVSDSDATNSSKCLTVEECREEGDAAYNIMFPYPLERDQDDGFLDESEDDEFIPREDISSDQALIANGSPQVQ